jgi:phosphohistidine phosphatase
MISGRHPRRQRRVPPGPESETMNSLYILRHAIAAERGAGGFAKDSDRPLTPEGRQKLRRVARAMTKLELDIELIVSSPFVRARQTAELAADALHLREKLQFSDHLTPQGKPEDLIEELKHLRPGPDGVLLVGHEPYLGKLVSLLVTGTPDLSLTLKKAGLCKLTLTGLTAGRCAILEWLLTPKQLGLMA